MTFSGNMQTYPKKSRAYPPPTKALSVSNSSSPSPTVSNIYTDRFCSRIIPANLKHKISLLNLHQKTDNQIRKSTKNLPSLRSLNLSVLTLQNLRMTTYPCKNSENSAKYQVFVAKIAISLNISHIKSRKNFTVYFPFFLSSYL